MGQLIGVWAPEPGTGRTTITLAIAYKLAQLCKSQKILVCCANGRGGTLINTMGISTEETGIEDLVSFRLAGFTSGEYEKMLVSKGRVFFAGSSKMTPAFSQRFMPEFLSIFDEFRETFDMSIVDLPCGRDSMLCNAVLSRCDKVITVLEKDTCGFSVFCPEDMAFKENILVINKCDTDSPQNSDARDIYSFKQSVFEVPHCNALSEMNNKGKLFQYFTLKTDFCAELERLVMSFLDLKENDCCANKTASVNAGLFGRLKINFVGGQQ